MSMEFGIGTISLLFSYDGVDNIIHLSEEKEDIETGDERENKKATKYKVDLSAAGNRNMLFKV